jgi:hypothetical protein
MRERIFRSDCNDCALAVQFTLGLPEIPRAGTPQYPNSTPLQKFLRTNPGVTDSELKNDP